MKMTPDQQKAYERAREKLLDAVKRTQGGQPVEKLDLAGEGLVALPPEIGQLTALTVLDLYANQLTALPPEIGQLTALRELRLYANQLTALPPEIGQLASLEGLWLGSNQLISLPPEIGQLTALTELYLNRNQLMALPPQIGQLQALGGLYLDNNQLTALPPEMRGLQKLERLYLHGNPRLGLPAEILGLDWQEVQRLGLAAPLASPQAILDHYFARQAQGERPLNEVRLVLVGRGGAGKTSMVQRLVRNEFNAQQDSTPGIALSDWELRECAGEPVTVHVWDFAGQVITHSMHRYFLSHRTIYVLVLTQREDSAEEDAEYWLKLIRSYGADRSADTDGPPVLVALNKSDAATVKVDRGALRERYPFIVGFVETDCESGRGFAEMRGELCRLLETPAVKAWVRQPYPARWWQVKEKIRAVQQDRPHISWEEWKELCDACGVKDNDGQHAASRDLHTLGIALNYGEDERLRDNTVLRPSWVTHHCYNLIRHAERHDGELYRAELESVLSPDRDGMPGEKDPRLHFYLMRLMERFEAAYPLGDDWPPQKWLVPLGLPDSQPAGVEEFGKRVPVDAARLRYTYPSVPPGLVAQFIVRTHPIMEEHMQWARGTVLTLNGARALVRAVSKTEVEITAIGENKDARRDLAGLCRENLTALNRQVSGLEVREVTEVADGERVAWVNVPSLEEEDREGTGKITTLTDAGKISLSPATELDEFSTQESRLPEPRAVKWGVLGAIDDDLEDEDAKNLGRPLPRRSKPKPRIFISYSHLDERLRQVLERHLEVLKIQGLVHKVWHDRRIQPGMDWDKKIQDELAAADVVLLLVSTASLASGYINTDELRPALERHVKDEAHVVPIILERCGWVETLAACPPLKKQKNPNHRVPLALPRGGKPIRSFFPQSEGWHQVFEGLKSLLTDVKSKLK